MTVLPPLIRCRVPVQTPCSPAPSHSSWSVIPVPAEKKQATWSTQTELQKKSSVNESWKDTWADKCCHLLTLIQKCTTLRLVYIADWWKSVTQMHNSWFRNKLDSLTFSNIHHNTLWKAFSTWTWLTLDRKLDSGVRHTFRVEPLGPMSRCLRFTNRSLLLTIVPILMMSQAVSSCNILTAWRQQHITEVKWYQKVCIILSA